MGTRAADSYPRPAVQGGLFKAPMPPQHQLEVFGTPGGSGRRDLDSLFPPSPLSGRGSPHGQTLGTPRVDYGQQMTDHFTQHSPLTSRPSPDPYNNLQTPGTPHPLCDPSYLSPPPGPDQYNQQSTGRRPSPSHPTLDPYASTLTPRPPVPDAYAAAPPRPSTPRPQKAPGPFSQAPMEVFPPRLAGSGPPPLGPGLSVETVTFTPTHHQVTALYVASVL